MDYLTADEVKEWAKAQPDNGFYCQWCFTRLVQDDNGLWYCPNEMCLYEEEETIDIDEE